MRGSVAGGMHLMTLKEKWMRKGQLTCGRLSGFRPSPPREIFGACQPCGHAELRRANPLSHANFVQAPCRPSRSALDASRTVLPCLTPAIDLDASDIRGRWRGIQDLSCVDPPSSSKSSSGEPHARLASHSDLPLVTNLASEPLHADTASWNATDVSLGTRSHMSFPSSFRMSTGMVDPMRPRNLVVALLRYCLAVIMSTGVGLLAMLKMER
jgi:hypothetical protein